MGVWNPTKKLFETSCKVFSGLTDQQVDDLQALPMTKCDKNDLPSWISIKKALAPDMWIADPKKCVFLH